MVVYLNGKEVNRTNLKTDGEITYSTLALKTQTLNTSLVFSSANGLLSAFKNGENQLAIELHGASVSSPLSFDAQLLDNINKKYFSLGSEWIFSDAGAEPADQLVEKPTGVSDGPYPKTEFRIFPAFPNPFNPSTELSWFQPSAGTARVVIYDLLGRELAVLTDGTHLQGLNRLTFDASGFSAGLYFYSVSVPGRKQTGKVLLVK